MASEGDRATYLHGSLRERAAGASKILAALDLPPDPTSELAKQHRHFSAEAQAYRSSENARAAGTAAYQAADFAGLIEGPWRVLHQDVTLDFQPQKNTVVSTIAATVVAKQPKLTALQFIVSNGDLITAKFSDVQVSATITDAGQGYGLLTVDLPQAMTVDAQNILTLQRTAKLDCKPGFLGFCRARLAKILVDDAEFHAAGLYQ